MDLSIFGIAVDPAFISLALGLLVLIGANILLGSMNAIFSQEFDLKVFLQGCGKGLIVTLCAVALYFAGMLNPDVVAINVGGEELTILSAVNAAVLAGYYLYAKQVFAKLAAMLSSGTFDVDSTDDEIIDTSSVTEALTAATEAAVGVVAETVVEAVVETVTKDTSAAAVIELVTGASEVEVESEEFDDDLEINEA